MKIITSKKTKKEQSYTDEEFGKLSRTSWWQKNSTRFTVTDLRARPLINTDIPKIEKKITVKTKK